MRRIRTRIGMMTLVAALGLPVVRAQETNPAAEAPQTEPRAGLDLEMMSARARAGGNRAGANGKDYQDFTEATRGATKSEGLFTLYQKDDHLYAEIKPPQLDRPLLAPIAIARGLEMAGNPLNFGDEWVLVFHKSGDDLQLLRRNIHYKAPANTPLEKAVQQNYTDSILLALPIVSLNPSGGGILIDLNQIFLTDFAELNLGSLDRSRTSWHKVKAFPDNLELEVEATFGGRGSQGGSGVADMRGVTLVIHYSLVKLPEPGYKARLADDRVGHFLSANKDFGKDDPDTTFVRQVNRWRLEKADPKAKLSPPKKQIIWYVEDTVPLEFRPYVEDGILEWNKAFEKIGFRNALAVRWQEADRDEFDPEDIHYCTFRWITTSSTYAMSCLRANPLTGEMIDGDVIFDAGFVRAWKQEYALLSGTGPVSSPGAVVGEIISPILADKRGFGLPGTPPGLRADLVAGRPIATTPEVVPAQWGPLQRKLRERLGEGQLTACQYSVGMQAEMALAALALAESGKAEPGAKLPEEFLGQAIKMVVMHEVGHSLGLRHNFKASTMLTADQLNDTRLTREKGLVGSVMDYAPINIAPRGQTQGDYYTTTIGPYDYWAIEYAYKPIDGTEEDELKSIASRAPEPELAYATDEDMYADNDPRVNTWDLGADTCDFARERIALATELMKELDAKTVQDGESWARNRRAFSILLGQWGNAAHLVASHIGGQSVHRDHKGDKDGRDPIVPIPGDKQREALMFLVEQILSDQAFQFSPALLRRLGSERWYHWGSEGMARGGVDFPIHERILAIQEIALSHCLAPDVLARLQDQQLQADPDSEPLKMAEVFRKLTEGIWGDTFSPPPAVEGQPRRLEISTFRRNLQREHLSRLAGMVLGQGSGGLGDRYLYVSFGGGSLPADARSLARLHLREIADRLGPTLAQDDLSLDDTTRAHLEESRQRIAKVLDASLQAREP